MRALAIGFIIIAGSISIFLTAGYADEPFIKGERLIYEVRYKKMELGESILTFHGETALGNRRVYHVTFFTDVPSFEDTEELYAEKETFLPLEVHRAIKKMIGFNDRIVEKYDQKDYRVDIRQKSKLRTRSFSIQRDTNIYNAILLTYYYRTLGEYKAGDRFKITLPTLDFDIIFEGKEEISTPYGNFLAYTFTSDPPRFKLWLSADKRRIPLKIEKPGPLSYSLVIKSVEYQ